MDARDLALRNATYRLFAESSRAPSALELADETRLGEADVRAGWRRLHDEHALVLDDTTGELRMAAPFSAVPTPFRVRAARRSWYANCAWDAFGICAALGVDGRIETECPDYGDPIVVDVRSGRPDDPSLVFHALVPAAHWWDDIVFT